MDDQARLHLSPALYGRSEAYDPDEAYTASEEEARDTLPCESPPEDSEESPESDRLPIEYPHLLSARRMSDE